jgi:hypothetical protein
MGDHPIKNWAARLRLRRQDSNMNYLAHNGELGLVKTAGRF